MTLQKIGRYEIKSELGRGGMATVYKAYDPRFEREVALKVLPREMLHDPQFRVRFEREAKTIAALEHQAIVPVYDVGEEDGQPYFVMRCMTGGSLADIIAKGPISLATTTKIMERVAPALDEAHYKGVVHRDLKPGNILFDRGGEPYISDFGIAKITQSQGATMTGGAIIGTPAYMSPEQGQGETVDGRSDVYALGVILYEMLSGTQPYQATTPMAVVVKQITDPIPHILDVNPNLPSAVEAVIEKAMAKSPDNRFSSAGELYIALAAVASGQSADDAIKTASISATKMISAKTRMQAGKTRLAEPAPVKKASSGLSMPLMIVGGLIGVCLIGAVIVGVLGYTGAIPLPFAAPTSAPATQTAAPATAPATDLPAIRATFTPAPVEAPTTAPTGGPTQPLVVVATAEPTNASPASVLGGADKIAFIAGNEVWLMNVSGTDLHVLTNTKTPKTNLQWVPGSNTLVYISGTTVYSYDTNTGVNDTIAQFPFASYLDEFRVSPDGKQVAISLNRQMFIVPFDIAKLKLAKGKDNLVAMKGCLKFTGLTLAALILKEFRWGPDGKTVAWLFKGVGATGQAVDLIQVVDISSCDPTKLRANDEFPGTRFTPDGYGSNGTLPDFDWDGNFLFLMNTLDRNNGWGFMYTYTQELHKGTQENPVTDSKSRCCYRDARWSPDNSYVIFAFQNKDSANAPIQFYYVPVGSIRSGAGVTPLPLPADFALSSKEAPQFALHPAQP
jgi:serine/threonine-protein kinase